MATPPYWDGDVLRSVDLDLDVIQGLSGRVWVDDEDEFADHRVRWGYPRGRRPRARWPRRLGRDGRPGPPGAVRR